MNVLVERLHRLLRRLGIVVISARHYNLRYLDYPPATAFEDTLLRLFPDLLGLNFIQIGANNGVRADPIHRYIEPFAWTGLMFEPLRNNFRDLQRHCGANPRLQLRQAAVDVTAGRRPIYDLAPDATVTLPDWTRGLASFSRSRLEQAARELSLPDSAIVSEEVETISWTQIWQELGSRRCDLLVLDTEGYDIPLLRAADLAQHRPKLILFEHACYTLDERLDFYRELFALGYELSTSEGDTVAWLDPHR